MTLTSAASAPFVLSGRDEVRVSISPTRPGTTREASPFNPPVLCPRLFHEEGRAADCAGGEALQMRYGLENNRWSDGEPALTRWETKVRY